MLPLDDQCKDKLRLIQSFTEQSGIKPRNIGIERNYDNVQISLLNKQTVIIHLTTSFPPQYDYDVRRGKGDKERLSVSMKNDSEQCFFT